jgi:T-complex protein 1 subunit gamma
MVGALGMNTQEVELPCSKRHTTDTKQERTQGRKAQLSNIQAAKVFVSLSINVTRPLKPQNKTIADIIRTCLGPRAMLKMLLDPMGGIVMTNDGNAILREVEVAHPAAKSMIELSRTQDEEVGDGTTSVIILGLFFFLFPWDISFFFFL